MTTADDHASWYKDAVIYELHVRAFNDSDADGIGDFRGLMQRLDYLQDLGVTAIWLLPFYPSPLRDDGYDIADYTSIHPSYGTLRDFRSFLREAHRQGLQVITELVLNHTSDQHPWFQAARNAPKGDPMRDFYVWSDTPERYQDARVIFKDFEASNWSWDRSADAYYWHRFYAHQPDLNFDNPDVHRALEEVVDFWLQMGVDGLRLDAVPYLYEREGTTCENLTETHEYLKALRGHVDTKFENRMLLAEANQWPEDAVAYFGSGDECHMAFHFPLMPRMFMSIQMEDRFPVIDILDQTPAITDTSQWALFLRNHDELTLEMVTDEERDYMYRVYAHDPQARINLGIRRRLAPLLQNNRRRIELMNGLLFSLPGTPVIYYGDEIGMGDNIYLGDRNGVRTPMQWSPDRNAGFSRANPQSLYLPVIIDPEYHSESINVEAQQNNPSSLLWWMKRLIAQRKRYKAFGRGSLEFLYPDNRKILAFMRTYDDERILVVANLSRHAEYVELDLSEFKDMVPVELFGSTHFPPIGELPYLLTLGPHAFYWFSLERRRERIEVGVPDEKLPVIELSGQWHALFNRKSKAQLEQILPGYLRPRRWFGGKARRIQSVQVTEVVPVTAETGKRAQGRGAPKPVAYLTLITVDYAEGHPETYVLPLSVAEPGEDGDLEGIPATARVAILQTRDGERVLIDGMWETALWSAVLDGIRRRRRFAGSSGQVAATPTSAFRELRGPVRDPLQPRVLAAEQSNSSVVFGDRLILKVFRRPDEGVNPDLEIGRFLTEETPFDHLAPVAGSLDYRRGRREPTTLAILQGFVAHETDAWTYTLDALGGFLDRALAKRLEEPPLPDDPRLTVLCEQEPPELAYETIGPFLESVRLLGERTAELHVALASNTRDQSFAPQGFSAFDQRSLYQSMRGLTGQVFGVLRRRARDLPEVNQVMDLEQEILECYRSLLGERLTSKRIRVHGDYHLGQVLYTGKDFVIIDFEGEPARPLSERRIKRSPIKDVAGLIRSFHYAGYTALFDSSAVTEEPAVLEPWIRYWYLWVSSSFLRAYLDVASKGGFLPNQPKELEVLLNVFLLEKAVYELGYEANNRPSWLKVPVQGIVQLLEERA